MAAEPRPAAAGGSSRPVIGAQPWLTTLADLISVMLAFMVLAFAGVLASPRAAVPPAEDASLAAAVTGFGHELTATPAPPASTSPDYLALMLNRTRQAEAPSSGIVVQRDGNGLVIMMAAGRLFPAGDAALAPEMAEWLQRLMPSLPPRSVPVLGVGTGSGTDADRILALQRSLAVALAISSGPEPRPVVAYGFSSIAAALSWLRPSAVPATAPSSTAIIIDVRGGAD